MSTTVSYVGTQYNIPAYQDTGYAQGSGNLSAYLIALATGSLTLSGGTFTLTADADFGATYGLKSAYYKSRAATISSTGVIRLASAEIIGWRDNGDTADLELTTDASDNLTFNGAVIASSGGALTGTTLTLSATSNQMVIGTTNTTTLSFTAPSSSLTYTIPDAGGAASFVMTAGTQTIGGAKTFSSQVLIPKGSTGAPGLADAANTDLGIEFPSDTTFSIVVDGARVVNFNSSGANYQSGYQIIADDGDASTPSITFVGATDLGFAGLAAGDVIYAICNGAAAAALTPSEHSFYFSGAQKLQFSSSRIFPTNDNTMTCGSVSGSNLRWSDVRSVLINGADYGFMNGWYIREYPAKFVDVQTQDEAWFKANANEGIQIVNDLDEIVMVIGRDSTVYAKNFKNINTLDPGAQGRNNPTAEEKTYERYRRKQIKGTLNVQDLDDAKNYITITPEEEARIRGN